MKRLATHRTGMLAALALGLAAAMPEPIMAGAVQPGGTARRRGKPQDWRDLTDGDRERIQLAQIRRDHKNGRRWSVMYRGMLGYHPALWREDPDGLVNLRNRTHRIE